MESEAEEVLVTRPRSQIVMANPELAWLAGNALSPAPWIFFKLHLQGTSTIFTLPVSHSFIHHTTICMYQTLF